VVDRERVLAKLDELEGYVRDLRAIAPQNFTEYRQIEKKRACNDSCKLPCSASLMSVICWSLDCD